MVVRMEMYAAGLSTETKYRSRFEQDSSQQPGLHYQQPQQPQQPENIIRPADPYG